LGAATLRLEAVLEGSALRIGDLLAVRPGQILALAQPIGAASQCLVNGRVKFRGDLVNVGGRQAFQVAARTGLAPAR